MATLTVVATITAKAGAENVVEQALLDLIEPTRRDPGFIQFDLHRDIEKPGVFLFFENWENRALLEQHLNAPHLVDYQRKVDGLVESWDLKLMEKIG